MFNVMSLFGGSKSANDLPGNRKQADQWLVTLPANDLHAQQSAIVDMLRRLDGEIQQAGNDLTDTLEAVDAIDHHVQPLQQTLTEQYLRSPRLAPQLESRLWTAIFQQADVTSQLYRNCLNKLQATATPRANHSGLAQKLCVRGLYNLGNAFKLKFLRYGAPDAEMWNMLHSFFMSAESGGYEKRLANLYNNQEYSCTSLYLRAELLAMSHPGSLSPEQIELIDKWLLNTTGDISIDRNPRQGRHHYFIDLAHSHGALPIGATTYPDSCRGWNMSTLILQLQRTRASLTKAKSAGGVDSANRYRLLTGLEYAEKQWNPGHLGKLRKHPRNKSTRQIATVHGLADLCAVVQGQQNVADGISPETAAEIRYTETVDLQLYGFITENTKQRNSQLLGSAQKPLPAPDMWDTENESQDGYLIRFPSQHNSWLHLGSLIGVKDPTDQLWRACVVRRLIRTQQPLSMAGIQVITRDPVVLLLYPLQSEIRSEEAPLRIAPSHALLTTPIENDHFTLILDSSNYTQSRVYKCQASPTTPMMYFRLGRILEKGDLWIHTEALLIQNLSPGDPTQP